MKVSILGTEYEILVKKYDEEEAFERRGICAFCDGLNKQIVLCDMKTYKGWENESEESCLICYKINLRHEIVHAFFNESGLCESSNAFNGAWAKNEEMVDWIALQFPKMQKAFEETGCL